MSKQIKRDKQVGAKVTIPQWKAIEAARQKAPLRLSLSDFMSQVSIELAVSALSDDELVATGAKREDLVADTSSGIKALLEKWPSWQRHATDTHGGQSTAKTLATQDEPATAKSLMGRPSRKRKPRSEARVA